MGAQDDYNKAFEDGVASQAVVIRELAGALRTVIERLDCYARWTSDEIVASKGTRVEREISQDARQNAKDARAVLAAVLAPEAANGIGALMPDLVDALRGLAIAAASRECTMGDPITLLNCQAEVRAKLDDARSVLARVPR